MGESDEPAGWAAIDAALSGIYGDAKPHHWGTLLKWSLGGQDPLDGVSVYPRTEPVPHWHYVSYGMSELYDKESPDPDVSGWGFEFTFRLVRDSAGTEPPVWAANLMQNLARYVFQSGNWFAPGHHLDANGSIAGDAPDSQIRALAFVADPELGEIPTPHGRVQFLQLVGLTMDEYEAAAEWSSASLLELFESRLPLLVTDINRGSLRTDPDVAAAIEAGIALEGSNSGELMVEVADWDLSSDVTLRFGALPAERIGRCLTGRLPFGNGLMITAAETAIGFQPAEEFSIELDGERLLEVNVPAAALDDLVAAFRPVAGRTPVPSLPGLTIEIVPSAITDQYGNETGDVIG